MSKSVLIVEDEADVRVYLSTVLKANGFCALTAASAEEGLRLARTEQPDLISLDIMMPKQSGLSLYLELAKDEKLARIPVVLVTGLATHGDFSFRDHIQDENIAEPAAVLEKPVTAEEFIKHVDRLIGSRQSRREGTDA